MPDDITLLGASAVVEATLRGFMVTVRDGTGRTIGEQYFPVRFTSHGNCGDIPRHGRAKADAYAAAAAYADSINCR